MERNSSWLGIAPIRLLGGWFGLHRSLEIRVIRVIRGSKRCSQNHNAIATAPPSRTEPCERTSRRQQNRNAVTRSSTVLDSMPVTCRRTGPPPNCPSNARTLRSKPASRPQSPSPINSGQRPASPFQTRHRGPKACQIPAPGNARGVRPCAASRAEGLTHAFAAHASETHAGTTDNRVPVTAPAASSRSSGLLTPVAPMSFAVRHPGPKACHLSIPSNAPALRSKPPSRAEGLSYTSPGQRPGCPSLCRIEG